MGASTAAVPAQVHDVLPGWGVTQERVDDAVRRIVEAYSPLRVVAFGSWARGQARPDSDLDLAVFLDERSSAVAGQSLYAAVSERNMDIDILAFDVARHERLRRSRNSVHWYIEHEGRVLYERAELDPMIKELLETMEDDRSMLQFPSPNRNFGFNAQQAIEKLLKVLIAAHGATFDRTHDLASLCKHLTSLGEHVPSTTIWQLRCSRLEWSSGTVDNPSFRDRVKRSSKQSRRCGRLCFGAWRNSHRSPKQA